MIRLAALLLAALTTGPAVAQNEAPEGPEATEAPGAVIRGLDKVTGSTTDFDMQKGDSARFGRLTIVLSECRYPTEDPASDGFAFVTVLDDAASAPVFQGWMIASSPALNALDHQRYDVWLIRCSIPEG
jgi:hypothetical protein